MSSHNQAPQVERLLTLSEAQAVLRCSRQTLYRLVRRGQLHPIEIGRRRLIAATDLVAFIDTHRRPSAEGGEATVNGDPA